MMSLPCLKTLPKKLDYSVALLEASIERIWGMAAWRKTPLTKELEGTIIKWGLNLDRKLEMSWEYVRP